MIEHRQKTFVVTGANTGIGYGTAKALARTGGKVIITARSSDKGEAALTRLKEETGHKNFALQLLDLGDLASIRAAAEALKHEDRIDVLVNNAGLGTAKGGTTKDGFELIMGVNHIGTFAFTEALMPKIRATTRERGEARIINLSSAAHQFARKLDPENLLPEKRGISRDAYSESKMCNLLHAREMARRYGMVGIRAHAVHPGFVNSDFGRKNHFPGAWQALFLLTKPMQITPEKGAKTTLAAALSDDGAWNNGLYWEKEKPATPTLPSDPDRVARAMWDETERLLAEKGFVIEHEEDEDEARFAGQTSSLFPNGL
ncbi:SDR family NAD(P)-dependent oxidoreductase [Parvularcula lutaonensis]|uniref:SDR family NAD(P)-dependent oxidoreductase n=1 Tax=Parvularcula lutaonensis TaxID=491923 RepID=A0ABV7MDM2_9PROT|nr:SDR family NAD(P)-dependent oxidoreductase [Parvularcula lutaonensis]GGY51728.1 short-chain dehydrogenase [Parvularcula lutaonensis]